MSTTMVANFEEFVASAAPVADLLRGQERVLLASHIDADGISSAGIASTVLDRLGIEHEVLFLKSLDPEAADIIREKNKFTWFTDLGSSSLGLLDGIFGIITDHHMPDNPVPMEKRGNILAYGENVACSDSKLCQLNPHLVGRDGTSELSGAGSTFALAMAVSRDNIDLLPLAIVGAVGDMQDREGEGFRGLNRDVAKLGETMGLILVEKDIRFFGRESRGLPRFILYGMEKNVPGLDVEEGVVEFLRRSGIKMEDNRGRWRVWVDLSPEEKKRIMTALRDHLELVGMSQQASILKGEVYSIIGEKPGSGFYDVKEFSTMLNSCGRYERAGLGLRLAKGDREGALREAADMRRGHRKNLVSSLEVIKEIGVQEMPHLVWFNSQDRIRDTVVGTVAGMYLKSSGIKKPILAFANIDDKRVKASIRCSQELVDTGLDMSAVMDIACSKVGGEGGGHRIAAGATIDRGTEKAFADAVDEILASSWSSDSR